ncbi:hypothetical protein SprV_0301003600 [Sparganum proliferum]
MSSRFGPRPVGTDGTDFKHRERVAQQYNQSPLFKRRIRTVLYLQISVWLLIVAKLLPELCIRFGFVSKTFARKTCGNMPGPLNKVSLMRISLLGHVTFGIVPIAVDCPGFRTTQQTHQVDGFANLQPGVEVETLAISHCVLQSTERLGDFRDTVGHFVADSARRLEQQRLREMQDASMARKAEEIQGYVDRNEWKNFFAATKAVYGPQTKGTAPLLSADGSTLLTEKTKFYSSGPSTSEASSTIPPPSPMLPSSACLKRRPTWTPTVRPLSTKPSGPCSGYPAGKRLDRTWSLLRSKNTISARILLNRLNNHLEQGLLPESQCGFRRHRGTIVMIFSARQLQEKCQEMRANMYSIFMGLTRAFDTVEREGLWKIMPKFGCPERFTQMVRQFRDGMMTRVTDNGAFSEAFVTTNGVKQGRVLAPIVFSLMFSAMLMDV